MASPAKQRKGKAASRNADLDDMQDRPRAPKQQKIEKKKKSVPSSKGGFPVVAVVLALLAAGGAYFLRDTFRAVLEPWFDFEDTTLHGVKSNAPAKFAVDTEKRDAILEAYKHSWHAYERDAMGADEYHPISHTGSNLTAAGGIGYTVVDAIDTMMIMGLDDEVARARTWVAEKLDFAKNGNFSTFETTIRVLGGLLSAYHLSNGDKLYLQKAVDLADRMLPAFDTPRGLPLSSVNLAKREGVPDYDNNGWVSTAEATTLQLEFKYLSELTEDDRYWKTAENVMALVRGAKLSPAVATIFMDPKTGYFVPFDIRLGSRGDSFYEYLLKQYLQTSKEEEVYNQMYKETMDAVIEHLVQYSYRARLTYTSELIPERRGESGEMLWKRIPKQDHLVCFLGGSLMLGATTSGAVGEHVSVPPHPSELTTEGRRDWRVGYELIRTCMNTHKTRTGLAPEIVHFREKNDGVDQEIVGAPFDWYIKGSERGKPPPLDARYILRPETVESLFIAYRLTGDQLYREYGWRIFRAIQTFCRVESGGYVSILNVDVLPVEREDKMETFFLSETLKYLYLLFSDDTLLPLSKYVFNTEAHPLPIFKPSIRTGFS